MDVDVIIEDDMEKIFPFLDSLNQEGFDASIEQARMGFSANESIPIFDTKSIMRIDLKVARTKEENDVLRDATVEILKNMNVRVARPEYILFGKLWYMGDVSDVEDKDLLQYNDVRDFIAVFRQNPGLDMALLEALLQGKSLVGTFNRFLELIKKLDS